MYPWPCKGSLSDFNNFWDFQSRTYIVYNILRFIEQIDFLKELFPKIKCSMFRFVVSCNTDLFRRLEVTGKTRDDAKPRWSNKMLKAVASGFLPRFFLCFFLPLSLILIVLSHSLSLSLSYYLVWLLKHVLRFFYCSVVIKCFFFSLKLSLIFDTERFAQKCSSHIAPANVYTSLSPSLTHALSLSYALSNTLSLK